MMREEIVPDFANIEAWIFDLDNTLYPPSCNLFAQVDERMTAYVRTLLDVPYEAARKIQKDLYRDYGTTLRGLMDRYRIEPDDFLSYVHDIDYSWLEPDPLMGQALSRLDGRKLVFTNGSRRHAQRTLEQLGIAHGFEAIFDIKDADYTPKPARASYEKFLRDFDLDPERAVMFEDMECNLLEPKALGMRTVLVVPRQQADQPAKAPVDFVTNNLTMFLRELDCGG